MSHARSVGALLLAFLVAACSDSLPTTMAGVCTEVETQRARAAALDLEVGEVLELCDPVAMSAIRLPGGDATREFLVVVANADVVADQLEHFQLRLADPGSVLAHGPADGLLLSAANAPAASVAPASPGEARIRAYESGLPGPAEAARLWARVREQREVPGGPRAALAAATPQLGDQVVVRVPDPQTRNLCFDYVAVNAIVRAVGEHVLVLEDPAVPFGGFDHNQFMDLALEYDQLHDMVVRTYFGAPTDLDGDGRVHLLITPEVNRLGARTSSSFVSGYFFGGDLLPRFDDGLWPVCLQSNEREILYLLAPDPLGSLSGRRHTVADVRRQLRGTIVHELQHMVNFGVRQRNRADAEAVWLNEAMSHLAEELAGRRLRGLGDFQQISTADLIDGGMGVYDYQSFFLQNLLRFRSWLTRPDTTSPTSAAVRTELAPRGAAWALLRYAADHHADDDLPAFLRALAAGPSSGARNLGVVAGVPFDSLLTGWMIANFADDLDLPARAARHGYRSWRMRAAISDATGPVPTTGNPYPLRITMLSPGAAPVSITTLSASGAYYGVRDESAAGGGLLSVLPANGTAGAAPGARLLVMRVR